MKPTEWKIYRSRRLWTVIAANQLGIFALFFWLFGKHAFFLIGPFTLYNFIIYFFPYWFPMTMNHPTNKGLKFQQFIKKAKVIIPDPIHLDIRFFENDFYNLIVMTHNRRLWIYTSQSFIEQLSDSETELLLKEIETLRAQGRLQYSTLFSALQYTLRIGFWRHNRGSELIFFSQNKDIPWQQLNFKVFHWSDGKNTTCHSSLWPCMVFPALTSYNPASYFSVYNFLRQKLITALKSEETSYGK